MVLGHPEAADRHRRSVGVFPTRRAAEQALHALRDSGFPMDRVSVIARDAGREGDIAGAEVHDRNEVGNKADEGARTGAISGGALGGLTGLLVGLGALAIPGIGPIVLAGAEATVLATALAGGALGAVAGGLVGALVGLGIPEEQARVYNERVSRGEYLVLVNGTDAELARAEAILHRGGIQEYGIYDIPGTSAPATPTSATPTSAIPVATVAPVAHTTTTRTVNTTSDTTPSVASTQQVRQSKRAIGLFHHRHDAEVALMELRDAGFAMDQVSVLAKDAGRNDQIAGVDMNANAGTGNKADDGAKAGAVTGAAAGGLGGLLVGLGALAIPGIGPVIAGGAAATALATALTGGAIGAAAGGITGALVGLGIPENQAKIYNDRLNRGDYLIMVDGYEDEVRRAEAILKRCGIQEWHLFDASDVDTHGRSDRLPDQNRSLIYEDRANTSAAVHQVSDGPEVVIVDRRDETLH